MYLEQIKESVYKIDSKKSGKKNMILGGVHGNEQTGIVVVKKMIEMFEKDEIKLVRGSVILALGNEQAIELNQRYDKEDNDLNRFFSKERLDNLGDKSYVADRARELAKIMKDMDVLLDIHSTLTHSRPMLVCENEAKHYEIHKWFNTKDVITDSNYILSGGFYSTTDEYVNVQGGVGVCFETGYAKDTTKVDEVIESIINILAEQKMIERDVDKSKICKQRDVYKMHTKIDFTSEGFTYEKGFGNGDFEKVEKGQIIGYHGDRAYKSPVSGIVLLQVPKEIWHIGFPVGYIAEKIK